MSHSAILFEYHSHSELLIFQLEQLSQGNNDKEQIQKLREAEQELKVKLFFT